MLKFLSQLDPFLHMFNRGKGSVQVLSINCVEREFNLRIDKSELKLPDPIQLTHIIMIELISMSLQLTNPNPSDHP